MAIIDTLNEDLRTILSNCEIFDFEIAEEDMAIIDTLNEDLRTSGIPEDLRDIPF